MFCHTNALRVNDSGRVHKQMINSTFFAKKVDGTAGRRCHSFLHSFCLLAPFANQIKFYLLMCTSLWIAHTAVAIACYLGYTLYSVCLLLLLAPTLSKWYYVHYTRWFFLIKRRGGNKKRPLTPTNTLSLKHSTSSPSDGMHCLTSWCRVVLERQAWFASLWKQSPWWTNKEQNKRLYL